MKATINSNRRPALNIKHVESVLFKGDVFEFTFFFLLLSIISLMLCLQDVIKAMLESCSRVLQGLAFNTVVVE
ncbi:unnamed protein product [Brassica oleracea var. botrytis]